MVDRNKDEKKDEKKGQLPKIPVSKSSPTLTTTESQDSHTLQLVLQRLRTLHEQYICMEIINMCLIKRFKCKIFKQFETRKLHNFIDYFNCRLEGENIPEDVLASGGVVGFGTTEHVVDVPEDDPDESRRKEEAERHDKRQAYIMSQSDRYGILEISCEKVIYACSIINVITVCKLMHINNCWWKSKWNCK